MKKTHQTDESSHEMQNIHLWFLDDSTMTTDLPPFHQILSQTLTILEKCKALRPTTTTVKTEEETAGKKEKPNEPTISPNEWQFSGEKTFSN